VFLQMKRSFACGWVLIEVKTDRYRTTECSTLFYIYVAPRMGYIGPDHSKACHVETFWTKMAPKGAERDIIPLSRPYVHIGKSQVRGLHKHLIIVALRTLARKMMTHQRTGSWRISSASPASSLLLYTISQYRVSCPRSPLFGSRPTRGSSGPEWARVYQFSVDMG